MAQAGLAALGAAWRNSVATGCCARDACSTPPQGPVVVEGGHSLANFASNDYLGPREPPAHPRRGASPPSKPAASAPAPLPSSSATRGPHEEAEAAFAQFTGLPRALLFPSGYAANLGILTALADRSAEIFADRLNHACLNDGAVLSRAAFRRYPHGDLERLEALLAASTAAIRVIATDTVFSMDGDMAPVARTARARRAPRRLARARRRARHRRAGRGTRVARPLRRCARRASSTWPRSARRSAATAHSSRASRTSSSG